MQKVGNNVVYFNGLTQVPDPPIKNIPSSLQSLSTLYGDSRGQRPDCCCRTRCPGLLGSMSQASYRGLGSVHAEHAGYPKQSPSTAERNITLRLRADAINLLNRPIWGTPNLNIDSTSFGQITTANGQPQRGARARVWNFKWAELDGDTYAN